MKPYMFVLVRYSVLLLDRGWAIQRDRPLDDYRKDLFSPERLRQRERLFASITLPTLSAARSALPDPSNVRLVILVSTEMPSEFLDSLKALMKDLDWCHILQIPVTKSFAPMVRGFIEDILRKEAQPVVYATMRLDDDDGVSRDFLVDLSAYVVDPYVGDAISFSKGFDVYYDEESCVITGATEKRSHLNSVGLTLINRYSPADLSFFVSQVTIYECGSHARLDTNRPVVIDSRKSHFLYLVHSGNDTKLLHSGRTWACFLKFMVKSALGRRAKLASAATISEPQAIIEALRPYALSADILPTPGQESSR